MKNSIFLTRKILDSYSNTICALHDGKYWYDYWGESSLRITIGPLRCPPGTTLVTFSQEEFINSSQFFSMSGVFPILDLYNLDK